MNKKIGNLLKSKRKELGLQQYDFEKSLGVGATTVSASERGNNVKGQLDLIVYYVTQHNVDARYFFGQKKEEQPSDLVTEPAAPVYNSRLSQRLDAIEVRLAAMEQGQAQALALLQKISDVLGEK